MKRFKKILLSKGVTAGALALAIGLLAFSGIGTARAVLSVFSQTYTTELQTSMVSVHMETAMAAARQANRTKYLFRHPQKRSSSMKTSSSRMVSDMGKRPPVPETGK